MKYYPSNFPISLEKPLVDLLSEIEKSKSLTPDTDLKKWNKILNVFLKKHPFYELFDNNKPNNWHMNFVLIRHHELFAKQFVNLVSPLLIKTKTRSISGIVPLTVFTKGTGCPFNCIYCPNEPGIPKSYFSDEPAVMRAMRHNFDPFKQTLYRMVMLYLSGHPIDKIEIIIKGGTFSFYPKTYRRWFIKRIFDAANCTIGEYIQKGILSKKSSRTLACAQKTNESAESRIIGINIETRPDFMNPKELLFLRKLGVTHIEMGVQLPQDEIYKIIKRGHTVAQVAHATQLLRKYGFKISYHLMPNLPGSSPQNDLRQMERVCHDPQFKPDYLKLYPTTITSHSPLFDMYEKGLYKPYGLDDLIQVCTKFKSEIVPPWMRIGRLTRDITTNTMKIKQFQPNFRELVKEELDKKKKSCSCIRCREIKAQIPYGNPKLETFEIEVSNGKKEHIFCRRVGYIDKGRIPPDKIMIKISASS